MASKAATLEGPPATQGRVSNQREAAKMRGVGASQEVD